MPAAPSGNTVAIIQARMGSTRLPGKVMRMLGRYTVLGWVIRRVAASAGLNRVVVATTTSSADDCIAAEAVRHGAEVFRGSEDDVLSRYVGAARASDADVVVRVTSDCPFFDPVVLAAMLARFSAREQLDYLSNSWGRRTGARAGCGGVFAGGTGALAREARLAYELEQRDALHLYHPELFAIGGYESPVDHCAPLDAGHDRGLDLIEAVHARWRMEGALPYGRNPSVARSASRGDGAQCPRAPEAVGRIRRAGMDPG